MSHLDSRGPVRRTLARPAIAPRRMAVIASLVVLCACAAPGAAPAPPYPDFSPSRARALLVATDVAIATDVRGFTDEIRIDDLQRLADTVNARVTARFLARSYDVAGAHLASIGLAWSREREYAVVGGSNRDDAGVERDARRRAPFHVAAGLESDTSLRARTSRMFGSLLIADKQPGQPNPRVVPGHPCLADSAAADAVIVLVSGRNVTVRKQLGQGILTLALTLGRFSFSQTSSLSVAAFVVECGSGEVVWAARRDTEGGRANEAAVLSLLDQILKEVP